MTTATIITLAVSVIIALIGSSGIWGFILYRQQHKDAKEDDLNLIKTALMGILFGEIMEQGEKYIHRGYITLKQLNNFKKYIFDPYKNLGGDGMADEVWDSLCDLPRSEEESR